MMHIKRYSVIVAHSAADLVQTVSRAIEKNYLPIGGVSMAWEPADPKRGRLIPLMAFSQAMVLPLTPSDSMGLSIEREADVPGMIMDGQGKKLKTKIVGGSEDGAETKA